MTGRFLGIMVVALLLILVFAVVAQAAVSQTTIDEIIKDAGDGTIDGHWSDAEIQAALDWAAENPTANQYTDVENTLTEFLGSLQAPGSQNGQLAFTGSELVLVLGAGLGLIGSGVALRRRRD